MSDTVLCVPPAPIDRDAAPDAFPDPVARTARTVFRVHSLYPYQRLVVANILDASSAGSVAGAVEAEDWMRIEAGPPPGVTAPPPEAREYAELEEGLQGIDARSRQLVILPTGAGKSLCFQLPARLLPHLSVVVYPLLSLMSDQMRRLSEVGIECEVLRGGQTRREREAIYSRVRSGASPILLTNPETLCTDGVLSRLSELRVSHLVIDEAHCVCEWGETFRPSYLELARCIDAVRPDVVTAFTATASDDILSGIRRHLFPDGCHLVRGNPDRSNIAYHVVPVLSSGHALVTMLRRSRGSEAATVPSLVGQAPRLPFWRYPLPVRRPAIVFCRSRTGAELTARMLRRRLGEDEIRFYHAGLSKPEKDRIEKWFYDSARGILVATCAYGMGVDKKNIRSVIHLDPPPSIESYLQESGRAGRDGNPANAVLLSSRTPPTPDADALARHPQHESESGVSEENVLRARQEAVYSYAVMNGCRRTALLEAMGWQEEACFGCDYCFGSRLSVPAEEQSLLSLVRHNRRRFSLDEMSRLARGDYVREDWLQLRRPPLPGWGRDECEEAFSFLLRARKIREIRRGFWRGRLDVARGTTRPTRR